MVVYDRLIQASLALQQGVMLGRELQLIVDLECLELPAQLLALVLLLVLRRFGSVSIEFHYLLPESNKLRFLVQE